MAKLSLKFQERVLREVGLSVGVVTIGRQPDNLLRIDNPAVSGHHAKIYWEGERYVLQDTESFNGTYVNHRRIGKVALKHGDVVMIGKHTVEFHAETGENDSSGQPRTSDRSTSWQAQLDKTRPPQLDLTMVLDTRRVRELLAKAASTVDGRATVQTLDIGEITPALSMKPTGHRRIGTLTVIAGNTNRQHYVLSSKLSVIGKSEMASIRLRRWFAPRIAASIHQREDDYFLIAAGKNIKIKVNNIGMADGQKELKAGDVIEVAGITATFDYEGYL
jgi:pSer/pThr/pTyr-binding forkhead associated (FHA) protein